MMLGGLKTVELRRRPVRMRSGSRLWVYSKLPSGIVELVAIVEKVLAASPRHIWKNYSSCTGLSRDEFNQYFAGIDTGYAVIFKCIHKLRPVISLSQMRTVSESFHPPQFMKRLHTDSPELQVLLKACNANLGKARRVKQ